MKARFNFYLLTFCLLTSFTFGQELKFKVNNLPDTTLHLVKYMGSKLYYADTAEMKNGVVKFDGAKQDPGIMALLMPDQKYFEFIFNDEDVFIETTAPDLVNSIKIKKSAENKVFYEYINFMQESQIKARSLSEKRDGIKDETEKEEISNQIKEIGNSVKEFQKEIASKNEGLLAAKVIKMSTDIEVPESDDEDDKDYSYRYFRDHYFDNIDLTDDRLVRTPIFQKKFEYFYSSQMLLQQPDTIIKYLSSVFDQLEEGSLMYRFTVSNATASLEKSKIMGMDKAFNVLVDKYYCATGEDGKPKAFWMDEEKLNDLCKDTKVRLKLVQGEIPPNIILTDSTNTNWHDFYSLESEYIILYFWDPGCGHCKKETPKLEQLYSQKLKDRNVEIFAVGKATGDDFEAWKKFIREKGLSFINVGLTKEIYNQAKEDPRSLIPSKTTLASLNYQETYDIFSTPRVWILDKDKKIVAKSLGVAQIEEFLDKMQGFEDAEKLFDVEDIKKEKEAIEKRRKKKM